MAKYKILLTVKDDYGKIKKVDGGTLDMDFKVDEFSQSEIDKIKETLPFKDYLKKENIDTELIEYVTDEEMDAILKKVTNVETGYLHFNDDNQLYIGQDKLELVFDCGSAEY